MKVQRAWRRRWELAMVHGGDRRILRFVLAIVGVPFCWWLGRAIVHSPALALFALSSAFSISVLFKPEWALYLLLSIGFSFTPDDIGIINLPLFDSPRDALVFAGLAGAILRLVKSRRPLPLLPIFVPLAFMVLVRVVTLTGHPRTMLPLWWMYLPQFQLTASDLYFLVLTLTGAVLTWLLVDAPDKARNVLISILVGVVLRTLVTTGWLLTQPNFFSDEVGVVRQLAHLSPDTPISTQILFGSFLPGIINAAQFFPVFLALGLVLHSRPLVRWISLVTTVAFIVINVPSGFRASFVALTTGPLVLLLLGSYWMPNRRAGMGLLLLSLLGVVLVFRTGAGLVTLASLVDEAAIGEGARTGIYQLQMNLFLQNPIFGMGYRAGHSDVFDWASGVGLLYLIPALVATLWPIRQLWRLLRSTQGIEERALLAGLLAGWVGIMVMATVNVVLTHPEAGMRFWSLAVIIGLWTRWHSERPGTSVVRISRTSEPPSA